MFQVSNLLNPFKQKTSKKKITWWTIAVFFLVFFTAIGVTGFKSGWGLGKKMAIEDNKTEAQELVTK